MLLSGLLAAQKHDHVWLFGIGNNPMGELYCGTTMDFNFDPPDIFYEYSPVLIDYANAGVCDTAGNLLFYTNGIGVYDRLHGLMPGSDTLNPGYISDQFYYIGYPLTQGVLILPQPRNDSLYYIFHQKRFPPTDEITTSYVDGLYYTIINMNMNGGLGGVAEKRILALSDTLSTGELTAVKHANGVDWWLLVREYRAQRYHRFLFTKDGLQFDGNQEIGIAPKSVEVLGQAVYSPDGGKFLRFGSYTVEEGSYLELFDFRQVHGGAVQPRLRPCPGQCLCRWRRQFLQTQGSSTCPPTVTCTSTTSGRTTLPHRRTRWPFSTVFRTGCGSPGSGRRNWRPMGRFISPLLITPATSTSSISPT